MESTEHIHVGNSIGLDLGGPSPSVASERDLDFAAVPLTYGQVVALAGDFYGTPDLTPISSHSPESAVAVARSAWETLAQAPAAELQRILAVIAEEQAKVADTQTHKPHPLRPSTAFTALGDSLSYKWNEATGGAKASDGRMGLLPPPTGQGRYLRLAMANLDHFGADAVRAYSACHTLALREAASLPGQDFADPQVARSLCRAYAMNAFADHFLTDLFSAGHLRTPRRALFQLKGVEPWVTGIFARLMHDEDNERGLRVSNGGSTPWTLFGDGKVLDPENAAGFMMAVQAVQASADEVAAVARGGDIPKSFAALELVPDLSPFRPRPTQGAQDHSALFWADEQGGVERRGGWLGQWSETHNYEYDDDWSWRLMLAEGALNDLIPDS